MQVTGLTRNLQPVPFCCEFNDYIISKIDKLISNQKQIYIVFVKINQFFRSINILYLYKPFKNDVGMKRNFFYLVSIWLFFAACSGTGNDYSASMEPEHAPGMLSVNEKTKMTSTDPDITPVPTESTEVIEKKIIKTAEISIEVEDFKKARQALDSLLKKYGAYVADESEQSYDYQISSDINIRVKADNFDKILNDVSGLAIHLKSKHIKLSDVSEEFIDINARLKNKKQVEQQYLELLKKARTIDEILKVNEHLRMIREEIESKEGRLKYLKSQVSLSTIYLNMVQSIESKDYPGFGSKFIKAIGGGWNGILIFILGLVYMWPFIILIIFIVWLIIRYRKKRKQKQNK